MQALNCLQCKKEGFGLGFSQVPDYLNYIKKPMDFWTMEQKLKQHEYSNLEEFEADFHLIVDNCTTYNSRDTLYYKAAVKMREQVSI